MIPLSQIVSNVRTRYEAESTVRWSDTPIVAAINDGLEDLSEASRFYERHISVPLGNLRSYYDLRGWMPETALGVTSVWNTSLNSWLEPTGIEKLGSRWERSTGTPLSFFMRGLFWMGVWPKPATSGTGYLRIYFAGYAPKFTSSQSVLRDLPDDLITCLEDYALYELSAQDGESDRALLHFADYDARSKQFAAFIDRRIVRARNLQMGVIDA